MPSILTTLTARVSNDIDPVGTGVAKKVGFQGDRASRGEYEVPVTLEVFEVAETKLAKARPVILTKSTWRGLK